MNVVKDYSYPVCFDFPSGHIPDNQALMFGSEVGLFVGETSVEANYM